jgi:hypothetical protein
LSVIACDKRRFTADLALFKAEILKAVSELNTAMAYGCMESQTQQCIVNLFLIVVKHFLQSQNQQQAAASSSIVYLRFKGVANANQKSTLTSRETQIALLKPNTCE